MLLSSVQISPETRKVEGVSYPENLTLQFVQIITRHGDRSPVTEWRPYNHDKHSWKCLENDKNEKVDCFAGQLTGK
jgi:hypothetical protein